MPTITLDNKKPVVYGTGLLALDIVTNSVSDIPSYQWAGGTCGNVMAILSYLGWSSYPIARLNNEQSSLSVLNDLKHWKVKNNFSTLEPRANVPVITQEISKNKLGETKHRFHWRNCPKCGAYLPNYKPVTLSAVEQVKSKVKTADVFFFDRVSAGAIELAKHFKELGAIIFFEPSAKGNPIHFEKALKLADIVKYSNQRFENILLDNIPKDRPYLEIQTLGENGLRYRTKSRKTWVNLASYKAYEVKDTCGCGDWTTAGIISELCKQGIQKFFAAPVSTLKEGILFGQALGAWSCGFEGARSGMYRVSKNTFKNDISEILQNGVQSKPTKSNKSIAGYVSDGFCPACPTD